MAGGDMNQRRFTRPIELSKLEVARRKAASELKVFLAGPYVEKNWDDQKLTGASPGARLRLRLIEMIESLEHAVVLGEHRGVAEVTTGTIPSNGNVVLSELQLVEDADAVVIVPDSPGSFCELGSWLMRDDFPPKTLILGNKLFESIFGYVSHGAFVMAADMHARVEWVDYSDADAILEILDDFLSRIQDRIISRRLRRGT
jgi:hypothetical protein